MLDFDAICGVPTHLAILLFAFDAWSWRYLSWPEVLLEVIAFRRCLTLTLFVVAGHTFGDHCFSWMLDFDAICRGRRYFWKSLLAFDAWFWCYLWCSKALGYFIVCLRCLILMLFVVAGHLLEAIACLQKSSLTAICRGRTCFCFFMLFFRSRLWSLFVVFQSNFEDDLSLLSIVCLLMLSFRSRLWTVFVVVGATFGGTICIS